MAGWKLGPVDGVDLPKCIVCVAPHTSNWDFIVGKLFYTSIGCNAGFLIKKEWFFFPFNLLFNWLGGVPVDRGKRTSVTDQMVERFKTSERFQLAVTPEGNTNVPHKRPHPLNARWPILFKPWGSLILSRYFFCVNV
jgi:1-acyl-sn-glycerol-3-phosphate acyltransferase